MERKRINWGETTVPLLALVFGIAYFLQTRDAPAIALYWPIIIAVVAGLLWIAVVVQFIFLKRDVTRQSRTNLSEVINNSKRPGLILFGSVGYLLAVPWLGFSLSNFFFMLIIFRGLGSRRLLQNIIVAAGITAFLHIALISLMKMSLPQLNLGLITF